MSYYGVQVTLIFILTFISTEAKKPPGYIAPPKEYDPNPPKYEYGYRIQEEKATHGKDEQRDGIYAQGRYYVEKGTESSHNVKYFADDWGYHPVVEYSNKGPYSKSSTNFALGEEAIKLKNNQKSIPQDPSDPGKAVNLAKLDPSNQNQLLPQQYVHQGDLATHQPSDSQPQLLVQQPQPQVVTENQSERPLVILSQQDQPQIVVQQDPSQNQPSVLVAQAQVDHQVTPTANIQPEILVNGQPDTNDNNPPQLIKLEDPQTIFLQSTPQPEIFLQKQPEEPPLIKLDNNQSDQSGLNISPLLIDSKPRPQELLIEQPAETRNTQQPLFYYVQPQQNELNLNIPVSALENQLNDQPLQPQVQYQLTSAENQLLYPLQYQHQPVVQQIVYPNLPIQDLPQKQHPSGKQNVIILQNGDNLPEPQALIYPEQKHNVLAETLPNTPSGPSEENQQILVNNDIVDVKEDGGQNLETAALTKIPNEIVEDSSWYKEFGAKINPKTITQSSSKNLIESTRNLVSGIDVLNINAAISQSHSSNDEIETNTLHSLLNHYVTPTIVNNLANVDLNHFDVISSTTIAPPITTVKTSLLREPIVVAEASEDSEHKPVIENTDENKAYFSSTSRSSLIASTAVTSVNDESSSDQILVTPRPVSSKFLAPITAGVQLQHIDKPIFEDTKDVEIHEGYQEKKNVVVQVQKTIPYYLGMYEYPLGYAAQYRGHNLTGQEKAIENIELGKTLLYFPGQESSKSERLVHEIPNEEPSQGVPEVNSNFLTVQQLPSKHIKQSFADIDQQALQGQQQIFIEKAENEQVFEQLGATESKVEKQFYVQAEQQGHNQAPTEVTKVVHQPYPVPYTVFQQVHYPVEKIVNRPVHMTKYVDRTYPVEVPVPFPQPYPVENLAKEPHPVPVHVQVPVPHPVPVEKKEPYPVPVHVQVPVEKIVERKVPVPYFVDRVVEKQVPHFINRPYPVGVPVQNQGQLQNGYLLQIPGLFSQQKYSTLVHNAYQPQKLQLQYSLKGNFNKNQHQQLGHQGVNPYSYASHINQYLPPKQELQLNRGQKLKKLNLLVFPRINVPVNLPPVTKNPYDLQQSQSYQSFRHSNAQLDNGYLPPISHHQHPQQQQQNCDHNDHQPSASNSNNYNVKRPEEAIGLIPPTRENFDDGRKYRTARSHFDDKSIRLEYGFMPPLIPSLEIDEQGQPIERDDNKN